MDEMILELHNELITKEQEINRLKDILREARKCINDFAIEEEDYSKIYSIEEREILQILDKVEENKKELFKVEIIEEDKKIERFDPCLGGIMSYDSVEHIFETYKDKINEIIDYLNKENK